MPLPKCLLPAVALLVCVTAHAQLRTIPPEAKPGTLRHLQDMIVELDGKPARLSPGAQIRDRDNRLVLPVSLAAHAKVRYLTNAAGQIHRVWILSAEEEARLPKPPAMKDDTQEQKKDAGD